MIKKEPKFNIICFSNQLWDYPLWTNKKHVMSRLAKQGHRVLFIDPPINTGRVFFRHISKGNWPLKRLLTWQCVDDNVRVFSPLFFLPFKPLLTKLHTFLINKIISKYFDKNLKTIMWVYHVELENIEMYLSNIKKDALVYDCVDNYAGFPRYNTPEKKESIIAKETYLAKQADIVFATAPGLVDKLKRYNDHVFFTPNVGDYDKFCKAKNLKNKIPADLDSIPRPRIGFSGAMDEYKFDEKLFKQLVHDHPKYSFVVIGPMALKDRDTSARELGYDEFNNVYFLGTKEYSLMPSYYAGLDVLLIPYVLNDYTVGGCFPVKFHDGLAAGLPVVVTDLPAYRPFTQVCYVSKSYNEFSQNVRRAIEEDSEQKQIDRMHVAKENNWDGKVEKMLSLVKSEVLFK